MDAVADAPLDPSPLALVDEYIDHARQCEIYRVRMPSRIAEAFSAILPLVKAPLAQEHRGGRHSAAFYSDIVSHCRHRDVDMSAMPMPPIIASAINALMDHLGVPLNSVLVDCCADGHDAISPHPVVGGAYVPQESVALSVVGDAFAQRALPRYPGCPYVVLIGMGATRTIHFVDKGTGHTVLAHSVGDGEAVILAGHTHEHYLYAVPMEPFVREPHYHLVLCNRATHASQE
ncbi:hypothetical protein pqer_cds_323 [Pandoravirus quercus]|uniref:Uncharacterized protein n=2 Tax=Pandoravirus TaxID=2060084 RepID=A0A2U7U8N1_9VIRU|nr:hypothetical protein pqer_cds_323 [Pandoravirus quercus]AVK74745.1 hypothetical protein pqer_cds_323 [Pandoravirus quercus]QBZ80922.1 hypothetical protein pclt_cds_324 [Pandoravirus celtis]